MGEETKELLKKKREERKRNGKITNKHTHTQTYAQIEKKIYFRVKEIHIIVFKMLHKM